ncbi:MAG TPA: tRNA lysidine(34) synthetase TilS [Armatimonadota bacterium]|jgi:tRNA(Ile)-lysidine synthase
MICPVYTAVRRFMESHAVPADATLIAAVSGGADSLALLHSMASLRHELGYALRVAHVHHGMRAEADDDVTRLQAACDDLGVPLSVGYMDVPGIAGAQKVSLEVAGRLARYGCLYDVAAEHGAHAICTGHTLDDQAETLLLRIVAGTGIEGLGGIFPARLAVPPESRAPVWLWRPLLEVRRAQTAAFCEERGLVTLDDPANADPRYPRNRVRHVLLPLLEREFNPAIRDALANLADLAREDETVLEAAAEKVCPFDETDGTFRLQAEALLALPLALRRRVARKLLRAAGGTGKALAFDNVERLLWAVRTAQRECHLHGAFALRVKRGLVTLERIQEAGFRRQNPDTGRNPEPQTRNPES